MKILFLVPYYPYPADSFAGIFNERFVLALKEIGESVEVLVPRPYVPPLASLLAVRWKAFAQIKPLESRKGVSVHRPAYLQLPRVGSNSWRPFGVYLSCLRTAVKLHSRTRFDAIISADLLGVGDLAWRLGKALGIPASGWAFGDDVRVPRPSRSGRGVVRALQNLALVFYQSQELLEKAAELLQTSPNQMPRDRHVVLSHGIPTPPSVSRINVKNQMAIELGIAADEITVLYTGRLVQDKGIFELLEAFTLVAAQDRKIACVIVGSKPGFDDTIALQRKITQTPGLKNKVKLLPACDPEKIWKYLCLADIFAFPSHKEGMPNSLLEAMAMRVPSVAFAIPPVLEIEAGSGSLITVPPLDAKLFSEAILRLASSPEDRARIGELGRAQVLDRFMMNKNKIMVLQHLSRVVGKGESYRNAGCRSVSIPSNLINGSS